MFKYLSLKVGLVGLLLFTCVATAHAKDLQYATYQTSRHGVTQNVIRLGKELSKATGGKATIVVNSGGSVASGKTTLSSIHDGLVDAGLVPDVYVPTQLPHSSVASGLALYGENPWIMAAAMAEYSMLNCPGCKSDLDKMNAYSFVYHSNPAYKLLCKSEVTTLSALKGRRISAAGPWSRLVDAWGAAPVRMPFNDVYEALHRGQLDCVLSPESAMTDFGLMDVITTVVDFPLGMIFGIHGFVINKDSWNALAKDQKEFLSGKMPYLAAENVAAYVAHAREGKEAAVKKGVKYVEANDEFKTFFAKLRDESKDAAIEVAKKRDIDNGGELISTYLQLVEKWKKLLGNEEPSVDKYAELLQQHIYSKVQY